jgi:predicted nucleotidyltransferase
MTFQEVLQQHEKSQLRKQGSQRRLDEARLAFSQESILSTDTKICVFAAGSLGRMDSGKTSDLDIFVTTNGDDVGRLQEIELFGAILKINHELKYPQLSNDGEFLKVFHIVSNEGKVGSAADDIENWFTTRMLLLLESNYLCNDAAYHAHKKIILDFYFRDAADQTPFKPLFLLNDILRFWRTLCLNYEQARTTPERSWKKRNFNLKFSRLLSVFGTVLPLILMRDINADAVEKLSSCIPMERLALGLDSLDGADDLKDKFRVLLDYYEAFLTVKETQVFDSLGPEVRADLQIKAEYVSDFIFTALNHSSVPPTYRRYLVI